MTHDSLFPRNLAFELAEVPGQTAWLVGADRPGNAVAARPHGASAHSAPSRSAPMQHPHQHGAARRLAQDLQSLHAGSLSSQVLDADQQLVSGSGSDVDGSSSGDGSGWLVSRLGGACTAIGSQLRPQGNYDANDEHPAERWINVLTSLPFVLIGAHMASRRRTPEGRLHAWSTVAVGATAAVYHASSGRARQLARKADYWVIAGTSVAMMKTLFADRPGVRAALNASLLLVPFRPLWVTAANAVAMQAEFARQAAANKCVRPAFKAHLLTATVGAATFAAEDALTECGVKGVHALWHLLSAAAVASMGGLLAHREQQLLAQRFAAALQSALGARAGTGGGEAVSGGCNGSSLRRSASDGSLLGWDSDACLLSPGSGSMASSFDDSCLSLGGGSGSNDSFKRRRSLHSSAASLYALGGGSPPRGASPPPRPLATSREM